MPQIHRHAVLTVAAFLLSACGGGGGGGGGNDGGGGGGGGNVTISGKVTFDRIPFKTNIGTGLDFAAPVVSPARHVVVEAVQPGNVLGTETVLASTTTDTAGDYSLQVPANRDVFIRAKARMQKTGTTPTFTFQVLNNFNGDALYAMVGATSSSGGTNSTRNLHADSGWGTSSYIDPRVAAPFAILDTIYKVKELILTAAPNTAFPALNLYWSTENRPSDDLCPDDGNIVSSLYVEFGPNDTDDCGEPAGDRSGIYVLGNFQIGDTDEFDQHIIAHEAGHAFESQLSRSDSIGGSHGAGDRLDLRVAFGEGWGNAFGAMVLGDAQYRDSFSGANGDSGFNIESGTVVNPGWFSEFSVHKFLWDVFDPANEPSDSVALGFLPIHNVMVGAQSDTDALTSIFSFSRALKAANQPASAGIDALLAGQGISAVTDDYGSTEPLQANITPVYSPIISGNPPVNLCGMKETVASEYNKLSNRRFLRFDAATARTISITVAATSGAGADPDVLIWRRGEVVAFSDEVGTTETFQLPVQVGTYIIEIYDYNHIDLDTSTGSPTSCMNVSIAG